MAMCLISSYFDNVQDLLFIIDNYIFLTYDMWFLHYTFKNCIANATMKLLITASKLNSRKKKD